MSLRNATRIHIRLAAVFSRGVDGGLQEIIRADAGDFHRILERQKHAFARPLLGGEFEQIFPIIR